MALTKDKDQKETAKEAIDMIMDAVNIMGSDRKVKDGIIEALRCSHRTLQENFWRVMIDVIKEYSTFHCDLRNEAAVNLCKFITEKLNENPEKTYLPYV